MNVLSDTMEEKDIELLQQFRIDLEKACTADLSAINEVKVHLDVLSKSFIAVFEKLGDDPHDETYWWKQTIYSHLNQLNERF